MVNRFQEYFFNHKKKYTIHKYHHYLGIYETHFARFRGKDPIVLEIGVSGGGSIEMWNYYFEGACKIYGVDKNPHCKNIRVPNAEIIIGDQGDEGFWADLKKTVPRPDIVVDDGGHTMKQQKTTFKCLYDYVKDDGVYLCEDVHTSYWDRDGYGGGLGKKTTFVEYTKKCIDKLNAWHHEPATQNRHFCKQTASMHYYDSVVVFEKSPYGPARPSPTAEKRK